MDEKAHPPGRGKKAYERILLPLPVEKLGREGSGLSHRQEMSCLFPGTRMEDARWKPTAVD
jgi:hypothetical protein